MLSAMQPPPGGFGPPPGGGYQRSGAQGPGYPAHKPITGSPETMALHAMTIDPKTGLPKGEKPPASAAAVLSLVCGILLCLGPVTGITAIIAGIAARAQVQKRPTSVGGGSMALWGIWLGALNLVISLFGLMFYVVNYAG